MTGLPGALLKPNFKPLWRAPTTTELVEHWPPKGYMKEVEVEDGNFWSLGRRFGRENPWDIIIFNFGTEDPQVVNWYLHNAVGCWKSQDNANFAFDSSITNEKKPGKIYIPHPGWHPDPKFQKGSGAGKFVHAVKDATATILTRLAKRIPTLAYRNSRLDQFGLEKVAEMINTGEVPLVVDPELMDSAAYSFDDKTIYLGKVPKLGRPFTAGVLANEATHAYTHWRSTEVNAFNNEMISSLAESVAAASVSVDFVRRQLENTADGYDQLYFPGWVWATELRGISRLGQAELDQDFDHPVHGVPMNPFTELVKYHDSIPYYHLKRRITWDHDWKG